MILIVFEHRDRSKLCALLARRLTLEPSTAPRLGHAGERGCAPRDPRSRGGSRHSHSGNPRYRPYGPVAFIWELFLFQASASVGSASKKRRSISVVRRELYGAPAKKSSGPENRDASISLGKYISNAMIFSIVFEHRDRSRHWSLLWQPGR